MDLIREMRRDGRGIEASELIQSFREEIKDEKKQILKEIGAQDRKKKHTLGICTNKGCSNDIFDERLFCKSCRNKHSDYYSKRKRLGNK